MSSDLRIMPQPLCEEFFLGNRRPKNFHSGGNATVANSFALGFLKRTKHRTKAARKCGEMTRFQRERTCILCKVAEKWRDLRMYLQLGVNAQLMCLLWGSVTLKLEI